jgi:lipid-A-disaccharide synthase
MIVFFDFEKQFYKKHGLDVLCVGHPLIDTIKISASKEDVLRSLKLSLNNLTIGILPGSRQKEIEMILPVMLKAAHILQKKYSHLQFLLIKAPTIPQESIDQTLKDTTDLNIKILQADPYDGINACDLCMVASGTATLETAILKKPMVIVYKTSLITWLLAKIFVKIPYIGLVNIVAGKPVVPECIQFQATENNIASTLESIFKDECRIASIKSELDKVKEILGGSGAGRRAAAHILESIS